jgi:glycosyltransferase involved in cell wall biosynthesis
MSLRIVMVAPTGFFADYGCHVRILEEARALQAQGHIITIFAYPEGATPDDMRVLRFPSPRRRSRIRVGSHWQKLWMDPILAGATLARGLAEPVDVVHGHLHEGALAGWPLAKARRVPLILDYQGSLTSEMVDHRFLAPRNPVLRLFGLLERVAEAAADRIVTSSGHARELLAARRSWPKDRIASIPDGVDVSRFRPRANEDAVDLVAKREDLRIPPNRLIIGYLGLLAEYQGTGDLIRAARKVVTADPGTHFLVMGYPNAAEYERAGIEAGIGDHLTVTGRVPYADAPKLLRLCDIAVSPKQSETEGNGKLLNYMATGLPTVAYAGGVAAEFLGPDARLPERGNVDALAESILALVRDPNARRTYGLQLRERSEREFSWQARANTILRLYESVGARRNSIDC